MKILTYYFFHGFFTDFLGAGTGFGFDFAGAGTGFGLDLAGTGFGSGFTGAGTGFGAGFVGAGTGFGSGFVGAGTGFGGVIGCPGIVLGGNGIGRLDADEDGSGTRIAGGITAVGHGTFGGGIGASVTVKMFCNGASGKSKTKPVEHCIPN